MFTHPRVSLVSTILLDVFGPWPSSSTSSSSSSSSTGSSRCTSNGSDSRAGSLPNHTPPIKNSGAGLDSSWPVFDSVGAGPEPPKLTPIYAAGSGAFVKQQHDGPFADYKPCGAAVGRSAPVNTYNTNYSHPFHQMVSVQPTDFSLGCIVLLSFVSELSLADIFKLESSRILQLFFLIFKYRSYVTREWLEFMVSWDYTWKILYLLHSFLMNGQCIDKRVPMDLVHT